MHNLRNLFLSIAAFSLILIFVSWSPTKSGFSGLGFLKGVTREAQALEVINSGEIVSGSAGYNEPVTDYHHQGKPVCWEYDVDRWQIVELKTLPCLDPGGPGGQALAISQDGNVIVGYSYVQDPVSHDGGYEAVRWHKPFKSSGVKTLAPLAGYAFGRATSVSRNGSMIVGYSQHTSSGSTADRLGCYWTPPFSSPPIPLSVPLPGVLPGESWPTKMSSMALAIVGSVRLQGSGGTFPRAPVIWKWNKGTLKFDAQLLPLLTGAVEGQALDVSITGKFVVGGCGSGDGNLTACKWMLDKGTWNVSAIPSLPSGNTTSGASSISEEGDVILGSSAHINEKGEYVPTPWVWSSTNGTRTLEAILLAEGVNSQTGWKSLFPMDISSDGKSIVGTGTDPSGLEEGWIAILQNP